MCSPIGDGAAAAIIVSDKMAKRLGGSRTIKVRASVLKSGWDYEDGQPGVTETVAKETYDLASIGPDELDVVELHDASAPAELMYYETLGLCPKGEGASFIRDGHSKLGGKMPVNPSGGLKAKGHPIGATGVSMHALSAMQLTGEAGGIQIPDATLAGIFNMGGAAVANYVSILERIR